MAIDVSPLVHIEIAVPDVDAAADFLAKTLGAKKTQLETVEWLNESLGHWGKLVHVELGHVVLQLVEPSSEETLWAEHLRRKGPGVHNLTFSVENVQEAADILEREGVPTLLKFDLDWARRLGPDAVRENVPPVYMIGSEDIVGFRLELFENPAKEEAST